MCVCCLFGKPRPPMACIYGIADKAFQNIKFLKAYTRERQQK